MDGIERLIVIEDIRALQSRYVRLADSRDWKGLSGLFLPSASFTAYGVAGDIQNDLTGPSQIAEGVAAGVGSGVVIHHLFSYEIDVQSPVRANGVWAMEDWIDRSHETGMIPFKTMRGNEPQVLVGSAGYLGEDVRCSGVTEFGGEIDVGAHRAGEVGQRRGENGKVLFAVVDIDRVLVETAAARGGLDPTVGTPAQGDNPLRQKVGLILRCCEDRIKQQVKLVERWPFHVPVRLFQLGSEVKRVRKPRLEEARDIKLLLVGEFTI